MGVRGESQGEDGCGADTLTLTWPHRSFRGQGTDL